MQDSVLITNSQSVAANNAVNVSLVKFSTLVQTILAMMVTTMVVIATGVTITLIGIGVGVKPPIASNDYVQVYKHMTIEIYALANDVEPKGGNLTITTTSEPLHGKATIVNGKFVKYTSDMYYTGPDQFNYTVSNDRLTAQATVFIDVLNHAPEAVDFYFEVSKNSKDNKFDLFNEVQSSKKIVDVDGDLLEIIEVTLPEDGVATTDGSIVYFSPYPGFRATNTFNYTISDQFDTSTATIYVQIINNPPVANPDAIVVPKNTIVTANLLGNDYDPNQDNITIAFLGSSKAVQFVNPDKESITYLPTPTPDPYSDSFEYTITDGDALSTSYVTIVMVNTPPIAFNNTLTCYKNTAENRIAIGMTDDDVLDSLSASLLPGLTNGSVALEEKRGSENRFFADNWYSIVTNAYTISYTPRHGMVGPDIVEFLVTDGYDSTAGYVYVTVLNNAPIANNDVVNCSKHVASVLNVTANDMDPNGDAIKLVDFKPFNTSLGGRVERYSDYEVLYYAPVGDSVLEDSFEYTIVDIQESEEYALSATAKVFVTLRNDPPIANDDFVTVGRRLTVDIEVLRNDSDPNNDPIHIVALEPLIGASISTDSQRLVFVAGDTAARYTTEYTITDGEFTASATVHISVVNIPPVAVNDNVTVTWNRLATLNVIENDSDENGDSLTVYSYTQPEHGSLSLSADKKTLSYNPEKSYVGIDTFTYVNFDGFDTSNTALVTIIVQNKAPIAVADYATTHWTDSVTVSVLQNDTDPDGDELFLKNVANPPHGSVLKSSNNIKYTPSTYIGHVIFAYTVTDQNLDRQANVTIHVTNSVPVAENDAVQMHWARGNISIIVTDNDRDNDQQDTISVHSFTQPSTGAAELLNSKSITYSIGARDPSSLGTFEFLYDITDGAQVSSQATVSITVTNNNRPSAKNITDTKHWREFLSGATYQVTQSTSDADGDSLSVVTSSTVGFQINQSGPGRTLSISAPSAEWKTGNGRVTYTVSDGIQSATGNIDLTVYNTVPTTSNHSLEMHWSLLKDGIRVNVLSKSNDADVLDRNQLVIESLDTSEVSEGATVRTESYQGVQQVFYKPASGKLGSDIITFYISDGLARVAGTINITVNTLTISPQDQYYTIHWRDTLSQAITLPIIASLNLTDDSSLTLVSPLLSSPDQGGIVTIPDSRTLKYKQATGFLDKERFKVQYQDGPAAPQTISVTVEVQNNEPAAHSAALRLHRRQVYQGYDYNVLFNATDLDSDPLSVVSATKSSSMLGSISISGSVVTYTPPSPSFITEDPESYSFVITDGVQSDSGSVSLTIFNTPPVAYPKVINTHWRNLVASNSFWINVLTGQTKASPALSTQDYDPDPLDQLSVTIESSLTLATVVQQSSTEVVNFVLTSFSSVNTPLSFNYYARDGASNGQVKQSVQVTALNSAPSASSFTVYKPWKESTFSITLTGMTDPDPLDVPNLVGSDVVSPFASISGDGKSILFSKTVVLSDIGNPILISYKAFDGSLKSTSKQITVIFTDTPPVAGNYTTTMQWNDEQTINLLSLCSDAEDTVSVKSIYGFDPTMLNNLNSNSQTQTNVKGQLSLVSASPLTVKYKPSQSMTYPTTGSLEKKAVSSWYFTCTDGLMTTDGFVRITVKNTQPSAEDRVVTLARVPDVTQYTVSDVLLSSTDVDGDSLTIVNMQGATLNGNSATITIGKLQASGQFKFQIYDGQLTSTVVTITVNLVNSPPTCNSATRTINKADVTTFTVTSLCTDENGDALTFKSVQQPTIGSVSLSNSNTQIVFTAPADQSGQVILSFVAQDPFSQTANGQITVTITNRAPTLQPATWNLVAVRNTTINTLPLSTYMQLANAQDPDAYDNSRLTIRSVTAGTCGNAGVGTISVQNGNIVFNRVYTFSTGTCTFNTVIQDAEKNPSAIATASSTVTISLTTLGLVALGRTISVRDGDGIFLLTNSEITLNDYDPLGGTFSFEGFVYDTCSQPGFCRAGTNPVLNGDKWQFTSKSNNCQIDRFKYKIRSIQDPDIVAYAILNVQYTNCVCKVPLDIVIVIDSSGSVGEDNFVLMRDFTASLVSNFNFAGETSDPSKLGARMGVIRFSDSSKINVISDMTNSKSDLISKINSMSYNSGATWILDALRRADTMLSTQGRSNVVNKVMLVLFDGEPNGPCDCGSCRSRYSSSASDNISRENLCKSVRYPFRTCNPCDVNYNYNLKCMPCSDIVPLCYQFNSRRPDQNGNTPNGYWRVIPVGIGQALSNPTAQQMLKDMSYDPNRSFHVQWDQLNSLYQAVSDQTCNLIDISGQAPLTIVEPEEPESIKCGDIVTLRGKRDYIRYGTKNSVSNSLVSDSSTHPNTAGSDRRGLWQVVCKSAATGSVLTYGTTIALFNLQSLSYAKRNSNDYHVQVTGTASDFSSGNRVIFNTASNGFSTTGKVYVDNTICLSMIDDFLYVGGSQPVIAQDSCSSANENIFIQRIPWNQVNNLNQSPAISASNLPVPPNN